MLTFSLAQMVICRLVVQKQAKVAELHWGTSRQEENFQAQRSKLEAWGGGVGGARSYQDGPVTAGKASAMLWAITPSLGSRGEKTHCNN